MRFGSPNHWFCRTTEPDRTSGSAELPNRTESSVVHYLGTLPNIQVRALDFEHLMGAGILHTKLWISDS